MRGNSREKGVEGVNSYGKEIASLGNVWVKRVLGYVRMSRSVFRKWQREFRFFVPIKMCRVDNLGEAFCPPFLAPTIGFLNMEHSGKLFKGGIKNSPPPLLYIRKCPKLAKGSKKEPNYALLKTLRHNTDKLKKLGY